MDEENPVQRKQTVNRGQPLRQISSAHPTVPIEGLGETSIPESSMSEVAEPRDWILPVPSDKPEGEDIDWKVRKREMIEDLSFCVDLSCDATLVEAQEEQVDDVDLSDILQGLGD